MSNKFDKVLFGKIIANIVKDNEGQEKYAETYKLSRAFLSRYINGKYDVPPKPSSLKILADSSKGKISYQELMQICGYVEKESDYFVAEIFMNEDLFKKYIDKNQYNIGILKNTEGMLRILIGNIAGDNFLIIPDRCEKGPLYELHINKLTIEQKSLVEKYEKMLFIVTKKLEENFELFINKDINLYSIDLEKLSGYQKAKKQFEEEHKELLDNIKNKNS